MDREQLKAVSVGSTLAREMAKMEKERASWRQTITQSIGVTQQLRELTQVGSAYSQIAKDLTEFRPSATVISQQYKELLATTSPEAQAIKTWQKSQRDQQEHIRKMLEPLVDIRKSFMVEDTIHDQIKEVLSGLSGAGSVAKMWARQMDDMRAHTRSVLEGLNLGSAISQQLKDFEHINKQWMVAPELLGVVGSLKELQSQIGKVVLPTIDWSSAAALATLLGQEGFEGQLSHLGIEPDGSLHKPKEAPAKGLLSRKQSDSVALLSLLFALISMWMTLQTSCYHENVGTAQQVKNDEQAAKQMRQLESLNRLVEQVLEQAVKTQEKCFIVRDRSATVRSKPEHGSAMEGKLMPNEVVRAIDKDGKWIKVEYYHWLHEEYLTGWVLKKYLERVPLNYFKANS